MRRACLQNTSYICEFWCDFRFLFFVEQIYVCTMYLSHIECSTHCSTYSKLMLNATSLQKINFQIFSKIRKPKSKIKFQKSRNFQKVKFQNHHFFTKKKPTFSPTKEVMFSRFSFFLRNFKKSHFSKSKSSKFQNFQIFLISQNVQNFAQKKFTNTKLYENVLIF